MDNNNKPVVTPVVLKGANYLLWKRTTKTALSGRGLWIHVETDQLPKKAIKEYAPILKAYSYCETAKELWETLANVYGNVTNLTRVFEVKKAINGLHQEDLEFTKHFGKFRSLWAELEMLRPSTIDPAILNERKEQDKIFGLLLTLNPAVNDLIKHILRGDKLPTLDDVCSKVQKEQGSLGLFSGKEELAMANKGVYKHEDKKVVICDHCKKRGHNKDKCWILHPHLKPAKFKANLSQDGPSGQGTGAANQGGATAMSASYGDLVRKSDLAALIRSITALKDSGITFLAFKPSMSLVVDSGASHHMIRVGDLKLFDKNSKAFFMPTFTSNLLSVKRATTDLNCYTIFGPNSVHFQDIETGKILGEGDARGDLYVLENTSSSSSNAFSLMSNLSSISSDVLRLDNGGEYTSHKRKEHLAKHGILQQTSCPYTPQQNGVAERKNRHLMEVARSMMFHTNVTKRFWGDALMMACYLINRTPTKVLQDVSPYEVLNKTKPSLDHLRVFGCVCFVLIPSEQRSKLDAKSIKCMFLGYSKSQKGYKCYDPTNGRILISRDVKFIEGLGYYQKKDWESLKDLSHFNSDRAANLRHLLDHLGITTQSSQLEPSEANHQNILTSSSPRGTTPDVSDPTEDLTESVPTSTEDVQTEPVALDNDNGDDNDDGVILDAPISQSVQPRRSERLKTIQPRRSERLKTVKRVYYNNQAVAHPI
ncbi:PREDICTED: uncharacterized protein LOC104733420 [Camelina sativa]|uniref:Uncharacterized protein LOC104733420 n=1 Tax=Camelina sativa TaxID=90675 RepID=A0ABM0V5X6_CAMSA|nr:PREDICTED: uncharacterized protein LOC104733420 [Camelina sativa]